jgi:hypothetical protein
MVRVLSSPFTGGKPPVAPSGKPYKADRRPGQV